MKKFGILFALIAILTMAGTAFAYPTFRVSADIGTGTPFTSVDVKSDDHPVPLPRIYVGQAFTVQVLSADGANTLVSYDIDGSPVKVGTEDVVLDKDKKIFVGTSYSWDPTETEGSFNIRVSSPDASSADLKFTLTIANPVEVEAITGTQKIYKSRAEISKDVTFSVHSLAISDDKAIDGITFGATGGKFSLKFENNKVVISGDDLSANASAKIVSAEVDVSFDAKDGQGWRLVSVEVEEFVTVEILGPGQLDATTDPTDKPLRVAKGTDKVVTFTWEGTDPSDIGNVTMVVSEDNPAIATYSINDATGKITVTGVEIGETAVVVSADEDEYGSKGRFDWTIEVYKAAEYVEPVPVASVAKVAEQLAPGNMLGNVLKMSGSYVVADTSKIGGTDAGLIVVGSEKFDRASAVAVPMFTLAVPEGDELVWTSFALDLSSMTPASRDAAIPLKVQTDTKIINWNPLLFTSAGEGHGSVQRSDFTADIPEVDDGDWYIDLAAKEMYVAIKDNRGYDLNPKDLIILDPIVVAAPSNTTPKPPVTDVSSGCNAAFAPLALLLLAAPLFFRKKK